MARGMSLNVGIKGITRETRLADIEVPAKLRERRPTGLEWWDEVFGGEGHVPSTVIMLTGTPGAGKSTLFRQLASALTQKHVVLFNTGEESLYQVKMAAERLKIDGSFYVGQHILCGDLIEHARELQKKHPKKQVLVLQDSLQTLNDGKYADGGTTGNTPVRCTEMLTDWAKETFGIAIFIGQVTKNGDFAGKNTILHAVDARAELYIDEDQKSETYGQRLCEVTKNRWGCSGLTAVLSMENDGLRSQGCFRKVGK